MVDLRHSLSCVDVPSVDEPVELASFLVELHKLLICEVFVVWALRRRDHFDALLEFVFCKVWLQALDAVKIERILYVISVDFNHVLMSLEGAEPLNPTHQSIISIGSVASSSAVLVGHVVHLEIFVSGVTIVSVHII